MGTVHYSIFLVHIRSNEGYLALALNDWGIYSVISHNGDQSLRQHSGDLINKLRLDALNCQYHSLHFKILMINTSQKTDNYFTK